VQDEEKAAEEEEGERKRREIINYENKMKKKGTDIF